jgi:hypothetical protein
MTGCSNAGKRPFPLSRRRFASLLAGGAVVALLAACTSAKLPPPPPAISANKGRVVLTRTDDVVFGQNGARIWVNDREVSVLMRGQTVGVEVPVGKVKIGVDAVLSMGMFEMTFDMEPGLEVRLAVAPRGANFVAGFAGLAGMLAEAAISQNKGPFSLAFLSKGYEPSGDSLEERLRSLNALRDKGEYSEAEYAERRKSILSYY